LIAKHRYSHSLLSSLQKKGEIKRKYQAITTGILSADTGIITKRIGRKDGSIIERTVREDGQEAITHYKTIKKTINHTFVDIELETGRTHQIRVHISSIGHPLVGDDLYGGSEDLIKRQALHCNHISFYIHLGKRACLFHLLSQRIWKSYLVRTPLKCSKFIFHKWLPRRNGYGRFFW